MGLLPTIPEGAVIPKIIHQTFHGKQLPQPFQNNVRKILVMNPTWEYRFYDDGDIAEFIDFNYGKIVLSYYNRINPKYGAARADLFRYLLMFKCGGVYLDIKSSPEKPLDDVIRADDLYLLSQWKNKKNEQFERWGLHSEIGHIDGGEFQQWFIVSVPGHPFLKAVIERVFINIDSYNPDFYGKGRRGALRVTGPIAYTLSIAPLLHLHRHRFVNSQDELCFSYSICDSAGKASNAHKVLFKAPHYSELNEAVVYVSLGKMFFCLLMRVLRKTGVILKRVARGVRRHGLPG